MTGRDFSKQIASLFKLGGQRAGSRERPKLSCASLSSTNTKPCCWIPRSFGQLSNYYAMQK
ncbi:MAG: hypothetical protein DMF26_10085 [Verrucomicrobia bacterium]|nr:MAG: hypothetical protein DMF26_10085 [Verrucomicrobiota bacterium]